MASPAAQPQPQPQPEPQPMSTPNSRRPRTSIPRPIARGLQNDATSPSTQSGRYTRLVAETIETPVSGGTGQTSYRRPSKTSSSSDNPYAPASEKPLYKGGRAWHPSGLLGTPAQSTASANVGSDLDQRRAPHTVQVCSAVRVSVHPSTRLGIIFEYPALATTIFE
eukprot:SAG31_NODE_6503_length_1993_cov_5.581837_1_plen_166_part_00